MCPTRPLRMTPEVAPPPRTKPTVMFPFMSEKAMQFAVEKLEPWECFEFLQAWLKRDISGYPEFTDWLAEREVRGASA